MSSSVIPPLTPFCSSSRGLGASPSAAEGELPPVLTAVPSLAVPPPLVASPSQADMLPPPPVLTQGNPLLSTSSAVLAAEALKSPQAQTPQPISVSMSKAAAVAAASTIGAAAAPEGTLHRAIIDTNKENAKTLLKQGISINVVDQQGQTPLIAAAFQNNLDMVNFILGELAQLSKDPVNVNIQDKHGTYSSLSCLSFPFFLLSLTYFTGWTALHTSAFQCSRTGKQESLQICSVLLQKKADASLLSQDGNTAMHYLVRMDIDNKPDDVRKLFDDVFDTCF